MCTSVVPIWPLNTLGTAHQQRRRRRLKVPMVTSACRGQGRRDDGAAEGVGRAWVELGRVLMYAGGGDIWTMSGDWGLGRRTGAGGMMECFSAMGACGKEADHAAAARRLMFPLQTGGNTIRRFIISPCKAMFCEGSSGRRGGRSRRIQDRMSMLWDA
ncbi:hypothetical protein IQ07DRAFT_603520 [Pyrenochaeta sp. DS3sAY3a]|nr:hypothetical protein IQ07DRAFT_603520 [Pyrenochaeta sp. DS3sAY3a]